VRQDRVAAQQAGSRVVGGDVGVERRHINCNAADQFEQRGDIVAVECISREGWLLLDCTLDTFRKLRKRRFVLSRNGGPYRVTREGLEAVRAQANNR
jgi:uncharacterized protein YjhX (UPF0386 family)